MNRLLILILFLSVFSTPSFSQDAGKYRIQQFTTDNGLPSNGIKGMEWDESSGFLWIATEAGISRYNGLDFSNFTKENTPGLSHERMSYTTKNNKGTLYAADVGDNMLMIKSAAPVYQPLIQLKDVTGYKKRFYLSIYGVNLQEKFLRLMNEYAGLTVNLAQLTDTSMAVVFNGIHAYYISANENEATPVSFPETFSGIFLMREQLFVVDKKRSLFRAKNNFREFEPVKLLSESGEPIRVNPANTLLYWTPGMNDPILFSDNNAWLLYDRKDHAEARLICSAVPPYSFIRFAQYSDKNKTLFIGTDSKGIIVISENRVRSIKNPDSDIRERNAYYSQVELPNGNVLTNEGHVLGPAKTDAGPLPISGAFTFTIQTTDDSLLWYSQANKKYKRYLLSNYNYKTGQTLDFPKIDPTPSGFAFARSKGQLYIATDYGLGLFTGDSIQYIFRPGKGKKLQQPPFTMIEFSPGVLGVASCDGLILYDISKQTTDTVLNPFGYCVRSLWKYRDYIFICTYGTGFYIWKAGKLKPMPLDKSKFLLYAHCVVPDKDGYCWISTNRGLFKAQLSDLLDAYEKDKTQVYYHYFGKNDGMDITEMNGGCAPCALVMKNNNISFPTMDGLLWVDPQKAGPLLPEGDIYIDEFLAGDKRFSPDSLHLRSLPYKARDIIIKLGFAAWCNKENIYLEYRLRPNSKWVPVDVNKGAFVSFNNLNSGKYELLIRKLNGFGIDNYSYKEIVFSIRTPWKEQWWFYTLCILFLVTMITLYLRFRTRQYKVRQRKLEKQVAEKTKELQEQNEVLEKNNSLKTRLISIISHDIVTPLKFVTVAGNKLLEKDSRMPEELKQETIKEMTNTSQELQLLSTNILNWIKYQNENRRMMKETFNLHEMVNQVFGILHSLARQKSLTIENSIDPSLEIHQYYEPLKILVYNLMTNAIHFTEKGTITVSAAKTNGHITLSVKDEGIGMTPEQIQRLMADEMIITSANVDNKKGHGLGYLIIKDLLKTMGATLHIESRKGAGAMVSIKM